MNGAILEYEDGTIARLDVIWLYPVLPPSQFVVTGPTGLRRPRPADLRAHASSSRTARPRSCAAPGDKTEVCFERQLSRFVDRCLAGTPPVPGLDEALASLELAQRIAAPRAWSAEVAVVIDFHVHQPAADAYGAGGVRRRRRTRSASSCRSTFTFDGLRRPERAANDSLAAFVAAGGGPVRRLRDRRSERLRAPRTRSSAASASTGCAGSSSTPGCRASRCTRRASIPSARPPAALGIPVLFHDGTPPYSAPLQLAALARRHPRTTIVLGHGGLHDLWREAWAAVESTDNVHICLCATPGLRDARADRPLPARADPLRHRRRPAPRAAPALRRAPRPAARRSSGSTRSSGGRSSWTTHADCSPRMIVDVHSHVPTHRERGAAGRVRREREVAAGPGRRGDDDVGRLRRGLRGRRRLGRVHDRPRPRAARPRAERHGGRVRGCRARAPDRLPLRPSGGRRARRTSSSAPARRPRARRASSSARTTRSSTRWRRPRCASTSSPSGTGCRSCSTRARRRCGRRRSGTHIRC